MQFHLLAGKTGNLELDEHSLSTIQALPWDVSLKFKPAEPLRFQDCWWEAANSKETPVPVPHKKTIRDSGHQKVAEKTSRARRSRLTPQELHGGLRGPMGDGRPSSEFGLERDSVEGSLKNLGPPARCSFSPFSWLGGFPY